MSPTLETAPTEFVECGNINFAFRRMGPSTGTPLVLLQHFTGHMDAWDPLVVNGLAASRSLFVFDNAGVGRSNGKTPDSVEAMALDAERFLGALGLDRVDLLGYSLGGFIAQVLAARSPARFRGLILVGTAPPGGEEHLLQVLAEAATHTEAPDIRLPLFFTQSAASQKAGRAFLARARARTVDRDLESGEAIRQAQAKALIDWCAHKDPTFPLLKRIRQPALVVSGSDDTMLPDGNAYTLFKQLPAAQLILYPDAGHGALFQYPDLFVAHAQLFLGGLERKPQ